VVLSGGVAVATAVKNGGVELVSGGGSATGIISSGGVLELIGAGQDVGAMTLSRGAILELLSGAFTGNAVSSGVTTKAWPAAPRAAARFFPAAFSIFSQAVSAAA
jgi:type V secretory pathway adhesin AidA